MPYDHPSYPSETKFYRVRPFEDGINPVSTVDDCWCPPPEKTMLGRVNRPGHPVLYTSPGDPTVAVDEMEAMDGRPVMLLEYTARRDLKFGGVMYWESDSEEWSDPELTEKLEVMRDFLYDWFTREVGEGTEYLYNISNVLENEYFNYAGSSGVCYPSVARKASSWNVAFYDHRARQDLELTGIGQFRFWDDGNPGAVFVCDRKYHIADNGMDIVPDD